MSVSSQQQSLAAPAAYRPRFGGGFRRAVGVTNGLMVAFAGRRWNPFFSVVEHVGRKTGRKFRTPVAARRTSDGFVVSLAFGPQVDWYRNLLAAGGGSVPRGGPGFP